MGLSGRFFAADAAARDSNVDGGEKDVALAFVGEHAQHIDPEVEKRVIRKIDLFLIPAMIIGTHRLQRIANERGFNVLTMNLSQAMDWSIMTKLFSAPLSYSA
jgi:hypothetical protein